MTEKMASSHGIISNWCTIYSRKRKVKNSKIFKSWGRRLTKKTDFVAEKIKLDDRVTFSIWILLVPSYRRPNKNMGDSSASTEARPKNKPAWCIHVFCHWNKKARSCSWSSWSVCSIQFLPYIGPIRILLQYIHGWVEGDEAKLAILLTSILFYIHRKETKFLLTSAWRI